MPKGYKKCGVPFTTNKPKKNSPFRLFALGKATRPEKPKGGWDEKTKK